ncbi:MAG: class I SAM-dependent methyltransferase [Candidatus Lokiarchaeota archaeon]|nr:class I SAM-dependent methyltransferase [Candidatus Lokiarchaeota archaeon]
MNNSKKINKAYKYWAETYDNDKNLTRDLDHRIIKNHKDLYLNKKILEPGCGTGKNTIQFSNYGESVISFDSSEEMLKLARKKNNNKNVCILRHNIKKKWPFQNEYFDVVSINLVLEHLKKIKFTFKESHRVLKRNGYFFLSEIHPIKHLKGGQAKFKDLTTMNIIKIKSYFHSQSEYNDLANKVGFNNNQFKEYYSKKDLNNIPRIIFGIMKKF